MIDCKNARQSVMAYTVRHMGENYRQQETETMLKSVCGIGRVGGNVDICTPAELWVL